MFSRPQIITFIIALMVTSQVLAESQDSPPKNYKDPTPILNKDDDERCKINIADNVKLYAVGGNASKNLLGYIDKNKRQASSNKIVVNEPGKKIALFLSSFEPSVWSIAWTENTIIEGVYVSGYHKQIVNGVPSDAKTIVTYKGNRSLPCGVALINETSYTKFDVNDLLQRVFNRTAGDVYLIDKGAITFGNNITAADKLYSYQYKSPNNFLLGSIYEGEEGLKKLVNEGKLTKLKPSSNIVVGFADMQVAKLPIKPPILRTISGDVHPNSAYLPANGGHQLYQINELITIPNNIGGNKNVVFYLPKGVEPPLGELGGAVLLKLETGECLNDKSPFRKYCSEYN